MLYLIGLGLNDLNDITIKGLETVKKCKHVFLDSYTSILRGNSKEELESFIGKDVIMAYREVVEDDENAIIEAARKDTTAFLVVGDPLAATTHSDLILRALSEGIPTQVSLRIILHFSSCFGICICSYLSLLWKLSKIVLNKFEGESILWYCIIRSFSSIFCTFMSTDVIFLARLV